MRGLAARMEAASLTVTRDGLATTLGQGGAGAEPALLLGSHTDSQPQGGWLDGALGVVYALEARARA